jgi:radical SAM superfamily enzyme YgiQ (UPF0313 family)
MMPRVLLVNLPYIVKNIDSNRPKIRSFFAFPYGLLSVATYNKDVADFKIIDCDAEENYMAAIIRTVQEFHPDIVGFSMMFDNSYKHLKSILEMIKESYPHILTILGGAAASYSYEEILAEQIDLDAICYSEGEMPLRFLLSDRDFDVWNLCHPSWITKDSLGRGVVPKISYIQNLDDVIDIDYSFVSNYDYNMQQAFSPFVDYSKEHKQYFLVTSRGCPWKCAFCSNAKIHGKKMRFASVDKIISHVEYLVKELGMDVLTIYDDQLLIDKDRAKDLFRKLARFNLRIEMPNGLSVRYIDDEMAELMRNAGADTAYLAIESGCEFVLKKLINKPLELSQVKPAVEALRKQGFFIHAFIVFGMPGETEAMRRETEQFLLDTDICWAGINMATPVHGSRLYDDCIKNGWIKKQAIGDIIDKKYIINCNGADPADVERQAYEINLNVNFHQNKRMKKGDYETAAKCFREVIRRYEGHEVAKHYLAICQKGLGGDDAGN